MRIKPIIFLLLIISGLLTACFDIYTKKNKIDGQYYVSTDAGADYKTLYYDIGDGNSIGRVENIKRAGHTSDFIIAEGQDGYYFIDRLKDNKFLNGSEIIGEVKSNAYFVGWLDSLKINNFEFDYDVEK